MQYVYPELKNLYNILEVDFHPLKLYEKIKPCIEFIEKNDDLAQYVPALEDIIVTRILKQVRNILCNRLFFPLINILITVHVKFDPHINFNPLLHIYTSFIACATSVDADQLAHLVLH